MLFVIAGTAFSFTGAGRGSNSIRRRSRSRVGNGKQCRLVTMMGEKSNAADVSSLSRAAVLAAASGAWAGWENSFNAMTARVKPLDESYVSPDLVEWGQVPMGWEVLSSLGVSRLARVRSVWFVRVLRRSGAREEDVGIG